MVSVQELDQSNEKAVTLEDLTSLVSQQVSDLLQEPGQTSDAEESLAAQWFYQVPYAGVRYYSY